MKSPFNLYGRFVRAHVYPLQRLHTLCARQEGTAVVEFGLVVPIIMILLAGTLDYAAYVYAVMNLNAATRGAVEYAKANTGASASTVMTYGNFPSSVTSSNVTVSTVCTCADNSSPSGGTCSGTCSVTFAGRTDTRVIEYIQVSATQNFTPWMPYSNLLLPSSLAASSYLRVQ